MSRSDLAHPPVAAGPRSLLHGERGLWLLCSLLSMGIFTLDLLLPLGAAASVPYILVVLLALRSDDDRTPLVFALLSSLLTLAGLWLSIPHADPWMVLLNRTLGLLAIWVSALLGQQLRHLGRSVRDNREQLETLTDTLPLAIAGIDAESGRYLYVNPSYAALFGHLPAGLLGHELAQVHALDFAELLGSRAANLSAGGSVMLEHALSPANSPGECKVKILLTRFRSEAEPSSSLITVVINEINDTTLAAIQLQRQLAAMAHVGRLATMGELAAKLAHELNQPLTAISGYTRASLRMMRAGQWKSAELIDALEDASLQAERAADIIRGLRNFLRKSPSEREPLDLPRLVDEVVRLVQHEARAHRIEIHTHTAATLPVVHANRTEIEQVLFNLLLNAIEAITENRPGRRQVTISLTGTGVGNRDVEIAVADSGAGFVEEVSEHLFDPFFSTKKDGMGMGLSICRTIIEAHGGELRARKNAIGGATFHFTLPATVDQEVHDEA